MVPRSVIQARQIFCLITLQWRKVSRNAIGVYRMICWEIDIEDEVEVSFGRYSAHVTNSNSSPLVLLRKVCLRLREI